MQLTKAEGRELNKCESIIERNLEAFYEVGNALVVIREKRLYRASYPTFEDYCREKWGMTRRHANRLIESTEVIGNLGPMGPKPENERQIRELTKLETPQQQRQAWQTAVETAPAGKVTAAHVRTVVDQMTPEEKREIKAASKEIRTRESAARRAGRIERIAETAKGNAPLTASIRYPVIYADPPWKYDYEPVDAWATENRYETMTIEEICALPVSKIATEDAILFLWATMPKLVDAIQAITAWGFTYKTGAVWNKCWTGRGYYFRIQHELLLIATRGDIPVPEDHARPGSIIEEKRSTKHSKKPEVFYEIIEKMYPELPKIELFARSEREGWDGWGNQLKKEAMK